MSSSGNNHGSSASDPIDLLSSSPEDQSSPETADDPTAQSPSGQSAADVVDRRHIAARPRQKREPDSSDGDTDSDPNVRRTRAFRRSSMGQSSSSSSSSRSRSSSQAGSGPGAGTAGSSSNPIVLGESPEPGVRTHGRQSGSRIARELTEEMRRSYFAGSPLSTLATTSQRPQTMARRASAGLPSVVLPRWQPDNEVTYCPICHTQFSFFVRKHHCRKCGRVVCDACSPHRITIPYQYIVQPPGAPRLPRGEYPASLIAGEGGYANFSGLGGGERVRLCNPCVPDPNITPPQAQAQSAASPTGSGHVRSQSTVNPPSAGQSPLINRLSAYMGTYGQMPGQFSRNRSATMGNQQPPSQDPRGSIHRAPASSRPYRAPTIAPSPVVASGSVPSSSTNRALPPVPSSQQASSSSSSSSRPRRHHQIPEEDECPVCHRELPSRALSDFQTRREEHITSCIIAHSSGTTPTQRGATGGGVLSPATAGGGGEPSSSMSQRRTGMFPYKATEKDCVDSAECTICLEEFEVGVDMARLECLCRFHRRCINAWFERHPGQCPMHQHDGFGF